MDIVVHGHYTSRISHNSFEDLPDSACLGFGTLLMVETLGCPYSERCHLAKSE